MLKKIAKNTFFLSSAQIAARLIGFFYFIFLARFLGVASFGIYNFTLAFVYNFIPVADFGLERLVLRDISRKPNKTSFYLARLLPLRLFLSLGAYLLVLLLALILKQTLSQISYLAIFGLFIFPYSITYLLTSFLNAKEKMKYMALAIVSSQFLIFILGLTFVFLKFPLSVIFLAGVGGQFLVALTFLLKAKNWGLSLGWVIDKKFFRQVLSQSWAFALLTIISVFYLRLSILMVNFLKGDEATGLYSSAFKFIEAMVLIPQSVALALFPHFSRLTLTSRKMREIILPYLKGFLFLFLISLPFVLALIIFPKFIVNIAYGSNYLLATPVFKILGLSLILFYINALAANIIHNLKEVKLFLPLLFLKFLIEILFCLLFIPKWSIIGAAWAVVLGEVFGLIFNNLFIFCILKRRNAKAKISIPRINLWVFIHFTILFSTIIFQDQRRI